MSKFSRVVAVVAVTAALLGYSGEKARAYNPTTHRQLVWDAIAYIDAHGTPSQRTALDRLSQEAGGKRQLLERHGLAWSAADSQEASQVLQFESFLI